MKKVKVTCKYCGATNSSWVYKMSDLEDIECGRCGDKNLTVESIETGDKFGYNDDKKDVANKTLSVYNKDKKE